MSYLGTKPSNSPLTSELIPNSIITNAKINDVAATKLTGTLPDANAPSGSVIQVVSTSLSSTIATTSTSYTATGLIASLTPMSTTSKILVMLNGGTTTYDTSGQMLISMYKQVASGGYSSLTTAEWISFASGSNNYGYPHSFAYLDSPSTTSTVYYQPYFKSGNGANIYFNYSGNLGVITLTLMEIAA